MSIGDIVGVSGASAFLREEIANLTDERDRARELAAHLEQLCAERERLLRRALWIDGADDSLADDCETRLQISRHLRETR